MKLNEMMIDLEALGNDKTKRIYENCGAYDPHFGISAGDLRKLAKKVKIDHKLAMELYQTGNYDAMCLAGMICDPSKMTEIDFEMWMDQAYFFMLSDYVVAANLVETPFAQLLADKWIKTKEELKVSAGYTCYAAMLCEFDDLKFDQKKIQTMLTEIENNIHEYPNRARYAMNSFLIACGISYIPLHEEASRIAEKIGKVKSTAGKSKCAVPVASEMLNKAISQGRLGYKRKTS